MQVQHEAGMVEGLLNGGRLGHLEQQQERELFDLVSIRKPVIAPKVAGVPEFLDDAVRRELLNVSSSPPLRVTSCGKIPGRQQGHPDEENAQTR
jgi:hypothetical protein